MILVFQIGDGPERTREVAGDALSIGRARTCDVVVEQDGVEDLHCRLERRDGRWYVVDNGTRNGTMVLVAGTAPQIVRPPGRPLADDDHVLIGHHVRPRFRGWFGAPTPATAPPKLAAAATTTGAEPPAVAALQAELGEVRAQLATALRERDANAVARDRARAEVRAMEARLTHDHAEQLRALQDHLIARDTRVIELTRERDAAEEARKVAAAALRTERLEREQALAIAHDAVAESNRDGLLAQQRKIVVEELGGQVAELEAQVAERDRVIARREAEITRLRARNADE